MSALAQLAPKPSDAVQSFLKRVNKIFIDGQFVDSSGKKTMDILNPADGKTIATVQEGTTQDIDKAVASARKAFEAGEWSKMPAGEREKLIWRLADAVEENLDEFAQLECLNVGKPIGMAQFIDIPLSIKTLRYFAGYATKINGDMLQFDCPYTPDVNYHAYTLKQPIGVAGMILPWNFPLLLLTMKLGPALAAGCTAVIKPSEETPLTTLRLMELAKEVGFPEGVLNVVTGQGDQVGTHIAKHEGIDKVAFTGSTEVGKLIVEAASGNLKKLSLELGGKGPNIVLPDADMDEAIAGSALAIFANSGQFCCAGSRLYVPKKNFDKVIQGITDAAKGHRVGPGLHPETTMGPLISQTQMDRVSKFMDSGRKEGVEVATGGNRIGQQGYFFEPTVLVRTNKDHTVVKEEIFGPVLTAMPYDDINDIIGEANDTPYGLAAGVWTKDVSKAHLIAKKLNAGTVWINCWHTFDVSAPFGGYKQSGWGREFGKEGIEAYTETKSVITKL